MASSLQDQILQAEQAGNGASVDRLQGSLRRNRSALAEIDKSLQGHDGDLDEMITSYIARLRFLQMEIFHLDEQLIAARSARSVADEALRQAMGRRAVFDAELLALQEELENLDFDLQRVDVSADGEHVFSAQVGGPYLELQQVNAALAALGPVLDKLQLARNAARGDFLSLQRQASAALAQVTEVIYGTGFLPNLTSNAFLKAGIDTLDYAYDVSKGFGQGGPTGALGAALKKGLEGWYVMLHDTSTVGAVELDRDYQAKVRSLITSTAQKVPEVIVSRYIKEAVTKPAKDGFNDLFLTFYEKIYGNVPSFYRLSGPLPPVYSPGGAVQKIIEKAKAFQEWSTTRQGALAKIRKGPTASKLSSLAYGFVKDITKAAAKAYLDQREQKAWVAYFEAESMSDAYLPIWMMASDQYWTSYDAFQGLEAKKAELLAGYEPSTMTRVTLDKSFPSGSGLTVTLTVARPPGATLPLSLVVSVAGRPAGGPGPGSTYTVSSKNLLQGKSGLGVSIEAR